jgi:HPt (histidine-containing phosphotransfer) domain-containing protein
MIDLELLEEYRGIPGRKHPNLREELLRVMALELPQYISALESQIGNRKSTLAADSAHSLAGWAANIGARTVHQPMLNLEREARDENWTQVEQIWANSHALLHHLHQEVENALRSG